MATKFDEIKLLDGLGNPHFREDFNKGRKLLRPVLVQAADAYLREGLDANGVDRLLSKFKGWLDAGQAGVLLKTRREKLGLQHRNNDYAMTAKLAGWDEEIVKFIDAKIAAAAQGPGKKISLLALVVGLGRKFRRAIAGSVLVHYIRATPAGRNLYISRHGLRSLYLHGTISELKRRGITFRSLRHTTSQFGRAGMGSDKWAPLEMGVGQKVRRFLRR